MNAESAESEAPDSGALVWRRRCPAVPRTVAVLRHAAQRALRDWGVEDEDAGTVALVVSELVTNSVRHGRVPGRLVALGLTYDRDKTVTVEVADASDEHRPRAGAPATAGELVECGRGLTLVAAFADEWGVRERVVGKTVWARVLVSPSGGANSGGPASV